MIQIDNLKDYVKKEHLEEVKNLMEAQGLDSVDADLKNPRTGTLLAVLTGLIGLDRLYQGGGKVMLVKIAMNLLSFGAWYIVDFSYTNQMIRLDNYGKIMGQLQA